MFNITQVSFTELINKIISRWVWPNISTLDLSSFHDKILNFLTITFPLQIVSYSNEISQKSFLFMCGPHTLKIGKVFFQQSDCIFNLILECKSLEFDTHILFHLINKPLDMSLESESTNFQPFKTPFMDPMASFLATFISCK